MFSLPVLLTFTVTVLFTLKDGHFFRFSLVLSECGPVVVCVAVGFGKKGSSLTRSDTTRLVQRISFCCTVCSNAHWFL